MTKIDKDLRLPLSKLTSVFELLRDLDRDLPIGAALSLLHIASGETEDGGIKVTDLQHLIDPATLGTSTASRYHKLLGCKVDRHGNPGFGLIDDRIPLENQRIKSLVMTAKGIRLLTRFKEILER